MVRIFWIVFPLLLQTVLFASPESMPDEPSALPNLYSIVIDRSSSMGSGWLNNNLVEPATERLETFINSLDENAVLEMVFFSSETGEKGRWSELTPNTKSEIRQWLKREFRPSGKTRLFDTVGHVLTGILENRDRYGQIAMLVFSDGEDTRSRKYTSWAEIERMSAELVARHPESFMRFYSLGREPRTQPGLPWKVQEVPDASELKKVVLKLEPVPLEKAALPVQVIPEPPRLPQKPRLPEISAAFSIEPGNAVLAGTEITFRAGGNIQNVVHEWYVDSRLLGEGTVLKWIPSTPGYIEVLHRAIRGEEKIEETDRIEVLPNPPKSELVIHPAHEVNLGQQVFIRAEQTDPSWRHTIRLSTGEVFHSSSAIVTINTLDPIEVFHSVDGPYGRAESREVLRAHDIVTAEFTVQRYGEQVPAELRFTPVSVEGIVAWEWSFGDGGFSNECEPQHTYFAAGEYFPVLTVQDITGRKLTYQSVEPVVLHAPRPWWLWWVIAISALVVVGIAVAAFAWQQQRRIELDGRLEWQHGEKKGRVELRGRLFDLKMLKIPGWEPVAAYTLEQRKSTGFQLLKDGLVEQGIEPDISLEVEGVRLRLIP